MRQRPFCVVSVSRLVPPSTERNESILFWKKNPEKNWPHFFPKVQHQQQATKQDKMPKILVRQEVRITTKMPIGILNVWRDYLHLKLMAVLGKGAQCEKLFTQINEMSHQDLLRHLVQDTKRPNFLYTPTPYAEQCNILLEYYEGGTEGHYLLAAKALKAFAECLPLIEYFQYVYNLPKLAKCEFVVFDTHIDLIHTLCYTKESYEKIQSLYGSIPGQVLYGFV
jgi:hypothetical protein